MGKIKLYGGRKLARSGGSSGGSRGGGSRSSGSSGSSRGGGGSFSGSRGSGGRSGGFSSGGRAGGSSSSNKNSGSFGGGFSNSSPRPRVGGIRTGPIINIGGSRRRRRMYGGGGPGGCLTAFIVLLIVIVIFSALSNVLYSGNSSNNSSSPEITASTIEREPLPKGAVNETAYYTDLLGWIGNRTKLESGLKHFYNKTGVQPYLYLTDNINGSRNPSQSEMDSFANDLYDELFTDEAHLLLVFFEYDERYMDWYVTGTQAKQVVDAEAADILLDYIDRYYYESGYTDEEYFSKSFSDAADRIMTVTRSPWVKVFTILGIVALIVVLFIWWNKSKKQKNLEAKQMEDILKTPLNKFGSTEAEDLAKKYEDKDK